jgi:hypothetical protein
VSGIKIGYARVSTTGQDLTAQRDALTALGVAPDRVYVDHGLTGTNRDRPGLREAMAACRAGDSLVVTKLFGNSSLGSRAGTFNQLGRSGARVGWSVKGRGGSRTSRSGSYALRGQD